MSFLKKAALSLGLALSSATYANAEEPPRPSLEQILKATEQAANKIAIEQPPVKKPRREQDQQWMILDQKFGFSTANYYALPNGFRLNTDGTVEGKGFSWKINDKEFYYKGTPMMGFFSKFQGVSYKDAISLDGENLRYVISDYEMEKDYLGRGLLDNANNLGEKLGNIAGGNHPEKLTADFLLYLTGLFMIYNDRAEQNLSDSELATKISGLSSEFFKGEVTGQDKQDLQDAINSFLRDTDWLLDQTKTGRTYKAVARDPMGKIAIEGNTLNDLNRMFGGLKGLIKYSISDEGIWAKLDLRAKGQTSSDSSERYLLKKGELNAEFNHGISYNNSAYARAFMDLDMHLSEGGKIYLSLNEGGLKLSNRQDEGIELYSKYLPSISLKFGTGYECMESMAMAESFQLSKPTKNGMDGIGVAVRSEKLSKYDLQIKAEGKLDAKAAAAQGQASFSNSAYLLDRERVLAYVFSKGIEDNFWYYMLIGAEYEDKSQYDLHDYKSYSFSAELNKGPNDSSGESTQKNYYEKISAAPRANAGAGLIGEKVNPFMTYLSYPHEAVKIGAMLDIPMMPSKITMNSASNNMNIRQASLANNETLALETSLVLFDGKGNKKALDYYTATEQDQMSPTEGKITDQRNATAKFYSDIDGLLINTMMEGANYRIRGVWGSKKSMFLGAGYFTNTEEDLKGGELILGCDRFSLIGGLGKSHQSNGYGNIFTLSAGGELSETMIMIDMHSISGPFSEETRYLNHYKDAFQGTLSISGKFDEANQLERITKDIIETLRRQRKDR